jgi:dihydrolipoamide dehydrogenase
MTKKNDARKYDVVILGAGPAGYVAAIRCAQLGMKTACVDEWTDHKGHASLGGTCLNVGCIPSKALLESSHHFASSRNEFSQHGIQIDEVRLDLNVMMMRKDKIIRELTSGIEGLFKINNVELIHGHGRLIPGKKVNIKDRETNKVVDVLSAENIIIATGSSPIRLNQANIKDDYIYDSAGALEFDSVPQRLGIIGAGAIGLELGSVWSRLGADVVLIEAMDTFLFSADEQIAKAALRSYKKQGLDIRISSRLLSTKIKNKKVSVVYEDVKGEQSETFDKLVVAVGRKPNSDRVFEDDMELVTGERGDILANDYCETSVPGIYAIGDVVRGPMLAHKGSEEGIMVAERIAGQQTSINYDRVPFVIYTHPEVAWAGKTEQACKTLAIPYKKGVFPIAANGRARAMGESEGMIKIIAHAETDRVLGVHIFSVQASELIAQAVSAMEMEATAEDIALTMFAHPTLSESIHEAALAVHKRAIHTKN